MPLSADQSILNGKYRILRLLGEGAAARVWLAEEPRFGGRLVAIKELRRDLLTPGDLEEQERRFYQEVRLAALLEQAHAPHVVRALTVEELPDGARLLVMAYADGGSLADLMAQHPQGLPIDQAVGIAVQVAEALHALHSLPVEPVHRDVKPSNILLTREGEALLGDFGLAQLAGASGRSLLSGGQHPGTPMTMAPEQERGAGYLTPAADVFALGCVLWEMLTGKRYKRFQPGTPPSQQRPDTPDWLDQVVMKALAEDAWTRWSSAGELASALRDGQAAMQWEQREAEAQRLARVERLEAKVQAIAQRVGNSRSPWLVRAVGVVALLAVTLLIIGAVIRFVDPDWETTPMLTATYDGVVTQPTPTHTYVPQPDTPAVPTIVPTPPAGTRETPTDARAILTDTPNPVGNTPTTPNKITLTATFVATPNPVRSSTVSPSATPEVTVTVLEQPQDLVILSPANEETITDSSVVVRWSGPSVGTGFTYRVNITEKPQGWESSADGQFQATEIVDGAQVHEFSYADFARPANPGFYDVRMWLFGPDKARAVDFQRRLFRWIPSSTASPSQSPPSVAIPTVTSSPSLAAGSTVSLVERISPRTDATFRPYFDGGPPVVHFTWMDELLTGQEYLLVVDYLLGPERMVYAVGEPEFTNVYHKQGTYRWWVLALPKGKRDNLEVFLTPETAWHFSVSN